MIAQSLLDGARIREPARPWSLAAASLLAAFTALRVLLVRSIWPSLALAGFWGLASYAGFVLDRWLVPLTPVLAAATLAVLAAAVLRRPLDALSPKP